VRATEGSQRPCRVGPGDIPELNVSLVGWWRLIDGADSG
jgi:hypothetical protein